MLRFSTVGNMLLFAKIKSSIKPKYMFESLENHKRKHFNSERQKQSNVCMNTCVFFYTFSRVS